MATATNQLALKGPFTILQDCWKPTSKQVPLTNSLHEGSVGLT
jgi:hypothetical protein